MKKLRVMSKNGEMAAEYSRVQDIDLLRKTIFEFILRNSDSDLILFVDTNNGKADMGKDRIIEVLGLCKIEYLIEEVEFNEQKFLGFAMPFRKGIKRESRKAFMIIARINDSIDVNILYDDFLKNYDYALCSGNESNPAEIVPLFRRKVEETLFNKEIFRSTFYDSVVVSRMRIDIEDDSLEKKLMSLKRSIL